MSTLTRRNFIGKTAIAISSLAALQKVAGANRSRSDPGPANAGLDGQNPDSIWPPDTDSKSLVQNFKYPFSFANKRTYEGGWSREVTVRELAVSKSLAGVNMRLTAGGVRELHWHTADEWAIVLYGTARITAIDRDGKSFVADVKKNDLWYFPSGIPHSIQGLEPDGTEFMLVFDDGNFSESETVLLSDSISHLPTDFAFRTMEMPPTKSTKGGEVRIVDSSTFKASNNVAMALVTVHPGGMRELHWHPNADEWQYYIAGKGRMTVVSTGNRARTMDFQAGDVGYVEKTLLHYIENTGDSDLIFLEMFKSSFYQDLSLSEWLAHTPPEPLLVERHFCLCIRVIVIARKSHTNEDSNEEPIYRAICDLGPPNSLATD